MLRIAAAGDRAILVTLGETMRPDLLASVLALERALGRRRPKGLISTVPAYASLLCRFDPRVTDARTLEERIREIDRVPAPPLARGRLVEVPVRYDGPDLERVAEHTGLAPSEVVTAHAAIEYLVYCLGFAPGFTYCGELPALLETPRLPSPRPRVPAGSVGIAGRQTGVYAVESPGGWNLIGHTGRPLFDSRRRPPALLRPGDRLRFRPVP